MMTDPIFFSKVHDLQNVILQAEVLAVLFNNNNQKRVHFLMCVTFYSCFEGRVMVPKLIMGFEKLNLY